MKSHGQYCPVARAAEILTQRWTLLLLRDLLGGIRRFNDLRRGVPLMSPSLLSKRLKTLEQAGFGDITTEIAPVGEFYLAEEYHQQYLAKNPDGYCGLGGTGLSCSIGS